MVEPSLMDTFCIASIIVIVVSYTLIMWRIWKKFTRAHHRRSIRPMAEEEHLCFICYEQKADVALVPCGHGGQCYVCARRMLGLDRRCPMCRASVMGVVFLMVSD